MSLPSWRDGARDRRAVLARLDRPVAAAEQTRLRFDRGLAWVGAGGLLERERVAAAEGDLALSLAPGEEGLAHDLGGLDLAVAQQRGDALHVLLGDRGLRRRRLA